MNLLSAGENVGVHSELGWVARLVARAVGVPESTMDEASSIVDGETTVAVRIESDGAAFDTTGMRPVTRGAHSDGRRTVLRDVGGSGFDLMLTADERLDVTVRYRPGYQVRAANALLSSRFALLAGQVLVHYPVLWRAGWRGRVPLHASVVATPAGTALLAGPGGVGKSTVLARALAQGGTATADNLCAADETTCYGLSEPLRTDAAGAAGHRTSHGRVESALPGRVPALAPDRIVVLERGPRTEITAIEPARAARALVAGTYAGGELRRYWSFAATMALATGRGPAHPPVAAVAAAYAQRLPCARVVVGDGDTLTAEQLCATGVPAPAGDPRSREQRKAR